MAKRKRKQKVEIEHTKKQKVQNERIKKQKVKIERTKKQKATIENISDSYHDLVMEKIFSFMPKSSHPTLALVSKKVNALVHDEQFFKIRSRLGVTRPSIFRVLPSLNNPRTLVSLSGNRNSRRQIRWDPSNATHIPKFSISFGGHFFYRTAISVAGPLVYFIRAEKLWIFNCGIHKWISGPDLTKSYRSPSALSFKGKIFVAGLHDDRDFALECLDPTVNVWRDVPVPTNIVNYFRDARFIVGQNIRTMVELKTGIYIEMGRPRGSGMFFDPDTAAWLLFESENLNHMAAYGECKWTRKMSDGTFLFWDDHGGLWGIDEDNFFGKKEVVGLPIEQMIRNGFKRPLDLIVLGDQVLLVWAMNRRPLDVLKPRQWKESLGMKTIQFRVERNGNGNLVASGFQDGKINETMKDHIAEHRQHNLTHGAWIDNFEDENYFPMNFPV